MQGNVGIIILITGKKNPLLQSSRKVILATMSFMAHFAKFHKHSTQWWPPKLTSSMSLAQIRESPHVANSNAEAHAGEDVLSFVVPPGPVTHLLRLHPLQLLVALDPLIHPRVGNYQPHGSSPEGKVKVRALTGADTTLWSFTVFSSQINRFTRHHMVTRIKHWT